MVVAPSIVCVEFQSTRPRGARRKLFDRLNLNNPFQSTRPRGARHRAACAPRIRSEFQSTRPRGARHAHSDRVGIKRGVSIHAPTRGATESRMRSSAASGCFNPRAHAGRDETPSMALASLAVFQSTRPRGARRWPRAPRARGGGFNPRAHAGRDLPRARTHPDHRPFQSTRPRGARLGAFSTGVSTLVEFQSTRPRGARRGCRRCGRIHRHVSIHAPTRGATSLIKSVRVIEMRFQSTRPRGARRAWRGLCCRCRPFQSTRPRGARHRARRDPRRQHPVSIHAPTRGAT